MACRRSRYPWLLLFLIALPYSGLTQGRSTTFNKLRGSPGLAITDAGNWKAIQMGAEFRKVTLERTEPHHLIDLKIVRFDTRWVMPRIVRSLQYNLKSANVKTLAEKSGAIAMINANYFDEKGTPLGFLKTAGDMSPNVSKSALFTGIFAIKDRVPFIVHRDQFVPQQADEGLQAGPLLLMKGSSLTVARGAGRQSRRSVIGIDADQRLIIAVTETLFGGLTWVELQELFGFAEWRAQTPDLLNLDGGGSAQLYVRGVQFEEYVPGSAEVPVAIGFFQK
jgi:hypothetical protein